MPQYRQGHILLDPAALPEDAVRLPPTRPDAVVIATGESGREHLFKGGRVAIFQRGSDLFIEIVGDDPVYLEHPEHGDIAVDPGTYRLVEQREAEDERAPRRSFD